MPVAGMTGFLTPMLVDRWSGGDPDRAGHAYAINVAGCILGPLVCGFLLLPLLGEHWSVLLLALPWFAMAFSAGYAPRYQMFSRAAGYATLAVAMCIFLATKDFGSGLRSKRSQCG